VLLDPLDFAAALCAFCKQRRVCMQADAMAFAKAAEQRMQAQTTQYADIIRDTAETPQSSITPELSARHQSSMHG